MLGTKGVVGSAPTVEGKILQRTAVLAELTKKVGALSCCSRQH
jgi:hypothetical protein